ncbi:DegT/DnrJ/EryC1/StrS family aminotransferase [Puia dinghuensis]|uniref:Aminotransferase DegT n=1 Tax=Puia dinghuensis TaxID=1792502 RepID=A0A8J2UEX8_9BACT|nr:DegT/DnrJ/EryC1/StrS family aminotransferase [Puia dinghuensis]GGB08617.1 aminotransferase DegT [Puia dinghuensis]
MINVTKTFLPPFEKYTALLKRAWDKGWITNNGELVQGLEAALRSYLGVNHLWFCSNGTVVLQMALKALNISGEVITTPFSYVATTTALLWENCTPVFADIDQRTFCIDPAKIESAITPATTAILATHVYGYPCDIEAIEKIARKHNLKVIYDGAHAFGTMIDGRSVLSYGDISTCSFHATKLFHTVEGGCIIANDDQLSRQLFLYRSFGHLADDHFSMGINGKNSEIHAAMGLCNLEYLPDILASRKEQWLYYYEMLEDTGLQLLDLPNDPRLTYNYAYFPAVFPSTEEMMTTLEVLKKKEIFPRRYFYPALNTLPYIEQQHCPVAESIANRVVCLPLYFDLSRQEQKLIAETILQAQKQNI